MLVEGSTVPPTYIPYGYKISILSGGVTTPIYLGEVETTRQVKKYEFNGSENWNYQAEYTRFGIVLQNAKFSGLRRTPIICTHYIAIDDGRNIDNVPNNAIYIGGGATLVQLFIKTDLYTTATDFNTYLAAQYAAGTPVTVWYVLAEPNTGILNEQLRKIGDYSDSVSVSNIPTTAGSQTFDIDTSLKPSEVDLTYHGWHRKEPKERVNGQWN